nr:hypothetical protein [Tanacetum cinerariifolium]
MLLLLVQGKLTNLTVEERFAFNVSLRMFTRSIVIQQRVEDLQLGVESYQKKLNLTKPDTYRTDLKCEEACTAYSNPIGFIYQNKDKQNRLMRINELHEFSDGTLNDVTIMDDRIKGIRMNRKYTTSVTKTKAEDYGHIKWIEDLVPRTMWSQAIVSYDKYALWGISYWGRKRQQFYGFAVNRESAQDVYSKRRIIDVTEL